MPAKATITSSATPASSEVVDSETTNTSYEVLAQKQTPCLPGQVCNVDLTIEESAPVEVTHPVVVKIPPRIVKQDKVSSLVKYALLPIGGAATGAGIFSAKWPTEFDGVNNSIKYGAEWKGAMVGAGVGLAIGVIVDLLDN
jgi:hypothetical protein